MSSCRKFEGGQTVPAYIYIDTVEVACDYFQYGANTHKIIDAWVYFDDQIVGCFELPALFPVLKEGQHKVKVYPGIARDGIRYYRSVYPFLAPWENDNVNLVKGVVDTLKPVFSYYPVGSEENMHIRWHEDFDGGGIKIESAEGSDVNISVVNGSPVVPNDPGGTYATKCGKVTLTSDTLQFSFYNDEELNRNNEFEKFFLYNGACMLEMDYKCSDTILVSLFYYQDYRPQSEPILQLKPTGESGKEPEKWNKVYINIGPYMYDYQDADYYRILFSSCPTRNDGTQYFYFDNLKLIYRDRL
ncbi:MAG: hypothetical protein J6P73_09020 [Bacteroidales bacterium]|nr:hypothetical protein [Bacteroidales bacterium]